ncbi:MAG: PIN domain-containing protein [Candidatus Aquilonibacter sp.]
MIFADTSAFVALLNASDEFHSAARVIWERQTSDAGNLATTNYIALETIAVLQRRIGIEAARDFCEALLPVVSVSYVDQSLHEAAWNFLLVENRRKLSLVDCTSFIYMRRNGIERAFSFDEDFEAFGFRKME